MNALLRGSLATLVGSVALLSASSAFAAGESCLNDDDCPGAECGGEICSWNTPQPAPAPDPNKPYTCMTVGTDPKASKGKEGWCTGPTAVNCKCAGMGATCKGTWCTFTKPSDAPAGTGGTGAGGTGAGTAGSGTAGSGTAGTAPKPAPADEGGCSVSVPGNAGTGFALALGVVGLGVAFARRRRQGR